ncbi:Lsr2 family protein [Allosaccharopolyspora coralli]|uniref:Lsr2 family protein n=1 Tax=Allosaccharopolyspora coralli TaxID=2665642 RepID=A0A5Q3QE56_9PSEU|nr:histone-like nucleoid-structuring protein Lsr2 [Allosaccharopolyspora coralli]QGK69077.1 Lsr2 family protein [Allosaccharopolyspora coralli]
MAERIQVELVDDIDGSPAQQSITFALDGVTYEIDLNDRHAQQLRAVFGRYIPRARTATAENSDETEKSEQKSSRQQREDQRNRRANRQLTEQIRGAARRTRERLNHRDDDEQPTSAAAAEPQGAQPVPDPDRLPSEPVQEPAPVERVAAVSLPQFSAAD